MFYFLFKPRSVVISVIVTSFFAITPVMSQHKIEAEVVSLRDGGFFPSTITRPHGKFLLVVKNRSHASEIILGVTRHDGTVIAAAEKVDRLK